jgi:transcriptional regulator with XRE-family HTH domain
MHHPLTSVQFVIMNDPIRLAVTISTIAMLLFTGTVSANVYRFTDEDGQIVISHTIPQAASTRGYDILNSSGRVIETIRPAPTAKEIADREGKQRQLELDTKLLELDKKLLERFSYPDEAVRAMYRKIRELRGLSQLKRGNISVIESQLDTEQSRAANRERSGGEISEATLKKIHRLEFNIRQIEREISAQQAEINIVKDKFLEEIERLETITGEARTLSIEVPSKNGNQ